MNSLGKVKRSGWPALAMVAIVAQLTVAMPAHAQDPEATTQEVRIRQLEAEVRALQRQVFPGGDVGAAGLPAPGGSAAPMAGPTTGMLTRMDSLEAQVARLTAQYEELSNHVRGIDARLSGAAPVAPPEHHAERPPAPTPLIEKPAPAIETVKPAPAHPAASRVAAVKAIVKPETGDAGEDEYTYGFKLWQAKFYPESEQQLQLFLEKYPRHARATYARNLIGRALLDDGNPREAAKWFLKNYEANQHGERAPDSMLFLAEAMVSIKDTNRACIALSEFSRSYAGEAKGRLHTQYDQIRGTVTCN